MRKERSGLRPAQPERVVNSSIESGSADKFAERIAGGADGFEHGAARGDAGEKAFDLGLDELLEILPVQRPRRIGRSERGGARCLVERCGGRRQDLAGIVAGAGQLASKLDRLNAVVERDRQEVLEHVEAVASKV